MPTFSFQLWESSLLPAFIGFVLGILIYFGTAFFGCRTKPKCRFLLITLLFTFMLPVLYHREKTLQPVLEGGIRCTDTDFCCWESAAGPVPFTSPIPNSIVLPRFGVHLFFLVIAVFISVIDFEFYLIPDLVMIPATVIAVLLMTFFPNAGLPDFDFYQHTDLILVHPLEAFRGTENDVFRFSLSVFAILFWVFALLDRRWYPRLGFKRGGILFFRRLSQSPLTLILPLIGLAGIAGIWLLYHLPSFPSQELMKCGLLSALAGMTVSMLLVWGVRIIGRFVLGREAMGFGDVILAGFLGVIFGWQGGLILFFLAPLAGLFFGILRLCFKTEREIPYGPFLSLAGLGLIFFWEGIHYQVRDFLIGPLVTAILVLAGILMALLLWVIQIIKRVTF